MEPHRVAPFDPNNNPLEHLHENSVALFEYVKKRLLINLAFAWEQESSDPATRRALLEHLWAQAAHASQLELPRFVNFCADIGGGREEFLALAQAEDCNAEVPLMARIYLALYFDEHRAAFTSEAFYRQYQESQGIMVEELQAAG